MWWTSLFVILCFLVAAAAGTYPAGPAACVIVVEGARQLFLVQKDRDPNGWNIYRGVNPRIGSWQEAELAWYNANDHVYSVGAFKLDNSYYRYGFIRATNKGCLPATSSAWFMPSIGMPNTEAALAENASSAGVHTLCFPRQGQLTGGRKVMVGSANGLTDCAAQAIRQHPTGLTGVMREKWPNPSANRYTSNCWAFFGEVEFLSEVDHKQHSSCLLTDLNLVPGGLSDKNRSRVEAAKDQYACLEQARAKYPGKIVGMAWNSRTGECWATETYTGPDIGFAKAGWVTAVSYPPTKTTSTTATPRPTTRTSTGPTSTGPTSTAPSGHSSHTGMYIAIGVGVPLGLLAVVGGAYLVWRKFLANQEYEEYAADEWGYEAEPAATNANLYY